MGRVFAYNHHDGFDDDMFLKGHELTDEERWCPICEEYDELIGEVVSIENLLEIIREHGIVFGSGEYIHLMEQYIKFSEKPVTGASRISS